jgi:hypothetical protein
MLYHFIKPTYISKPSHFSSKLIFLSVNGKYYNKIHGYIIVFRMIIVLFIFTTQMYPIKNS